MHILCVSKQARFSITNSHLEEEKEEEEEEEEEEERERGMERRRGRRRRRKETCPMFVILEKCLCYIVRCLYQGRVWTDTVSVNSNK